MNTDMYILDVPVPPFESLETYSKSRFQSMKMYNAKVILKGLLMDVAFVSDWQYTAILSANSPCPAWRWSVLESLF